MNLLYVGQAVFVSLNQFYPHLVYINYCMLVNAGLIILIELIQVLNDPKEYLTSPSNYLELLGNTMVIVIL